MPLLIRTMQEEVRKIGFFYTADAKGLCGNARTVVNLHVASKISSAGLKPYAFNIRLVP